MKEFFHDRLKPFITDHPGDSLAHDKKKGSARRGARGRGDAGAKVARGISGGGGGGGETIAKRSHSSQRGSEDDSEPDSSKRSASKRARIKRE